MKILRTLGELAGTALVGFMYLLIGVSVVAVVIIGAVVLYSLIP